MSRRIVVIGGTGFFGRAAAELLRAEGLALLVAARGTGRDSGSPPDLRVDADDPVALRRAIASGRFTERGLVPHDSHVDPAGLIAYLRLLGIECSLSGPPIQYSPSAPGETGPPKP